MSGSFPKDPDLQAFENWAISKSWFTKVRGSFRRNCNDTMYTHYRVNDRANAFLAGVIYARQQQECINEHGKQTEEKEGKE